MNWTKYTGLFKIDTDRQKIRQFGLILAGFLLVVAGGRHFIGGHDPRYFIITGFVCALLALSLPGMLVVVYYPWMIVANLLGFAITHLILIVFFYIILTPLGLIRRSAGKDSMARKFHAGSYWITRGKDDQSDMERMF